MTAVATPVFRSSSLDAEINVYDGQPCSILRQLGPDEADEEVGPMFEVEFSDGHQMHVFADEIAHSQAA